MQQGIWQEPQKIVSISMGILCFAIAIYFLIVCLKSGRKHYWISVLGVLGLFGIGVANAVFTILGFSKYVLSDLVVRFLPISILIMIVGLAYAYFRTQDEEEKMRLGFMLGRLLKVLGFLMALALAIMLGVILFSSL